MVNLRYRYVLNLTPFASFFILFLLVWIRIHKAFEYGSNTDPDPQYSSPTVVYRAHLLILAIECGAATIKQLNIDFVVPVTVVAILNGTNL